MKVIYYKNNCIFKSKIYAENIGQKWTNKVL